MIVLNVKHQRLSYIAEAVYNKIKKEWKGFSPDLELFVQVIDLPDKLQVLGRQGPPVADEHETRQEKSSNKKGRTSASADPHTVDSHHSLYRVVCQLYSTEHMPRYRYSPETVRKYMQIIYVSRAFSAKHEPRPHITSHCSTIRFSPSGEEDNVIRAMTMFLDNVRFAFLRKIFERQPFE